MYTCILYKHINAYICIYIYLHTHTHTYHIHLGMLQARAPTFVISNTCHLVYTYTNKHSCTRRGHIVMFAFFGCLPRCLPCSPDTSAFALLLQALLHAQRSHCVRQKGQTSKKKKAKEANIDSCNGYSKTVCPIP